MEPPFTRFACTDVSVLSLDDLRRVMADSGYSLADTVAATFQRRNVHGQAVYRICYRDADSPTGFGSGFIYVWREPDGKLRGDF